MNILKQIAAVKREEVRQRRVSMPLAGLEKSAWFLTERPSLYKALSDSKPAVIGEFKRRSPSKGDINLSANVEKVVSGYQEAGIAAVSVLTDDRFFGGNNDDLLKAAGKLSIPILRKDFIIDEYQIVEARAIGAAAILLIASILTRQEVDAFARIANELGMEVLFEIHDQDEIEKLSGPIRIIGINNRDLRTFDVNLSNSARLLSCLPSDCIKVAESGITLPGDAKKLSDLGFDAFLIGENFMRSEDPAKKAAQFITELKTCC